MDDILPSVDLDGEGPVLRVASRFHRNGSEREVGLHLISGEGRVHYNVTFSLWFIRTISN